MVSKPAKSAQPRPTARKPRKPPAKASASPQLRSVLEAVNGLLASMELDHLGEARAALARANATKLDQVLKSDAVQAALAFAGISKELREVLDAIQEAADDSAEFVTGLFAQVGDSAKS